MLIAQTTKAMMLTTGTRKAKNQPEGMLAARAGVIAENIARTARGEKPVNAIAFAD